MKDIYYISEISDNGNSAGTKARNDLEKIFQSRGMKKVGVRLFRSEKNGFLYYIKGYFAAKKSIRALKKLKDVSLVVQYPVTKGVLLNEILSEISNKIRLVFFIHDVNYLRNDGKGKEEEIEFLNKAHRVICHNPKMIERLINDGLTAETINLQLFDYLTDSPKPEHENGQNIVYAGNLKKGAYLDELAKQGDFGFKLKLFGINYEPFSNNDMEYMGSFLPEILVGELKYSYGLIWDGTSVDTCNGTLGEYTRYNNPHKLSLYMAAGLPVIVWKDAAIADFVEEHNVGITVGSLLEIAEKIKEITDEKYSEFLKNAEALREKVINGKFTEEALEKLED